MDSDLYSIFIDDDSTPMSEVLKRHELELSTRIVNSICDAIEQGKSNVEIARIVTPYQIITLKASEALFLQTLEINIETLIEYEEFLLCAKAQKFIDKLKQKKLN